MEFDVALSMRALALCRKLGKLKRIIALKYMRYKISDICYKVNEYARKTS